MIKMKPKTSVPLMGSSLLKKWISTCIMRRSRRRSRRARARKGGNKKMEGGRTRHLPEEIIMDILKRLPAKSVLRSKSVCKNWYNLIKTPDFIQMHLHHSNQMNYFSLIVTKDDDDIPTFVSIDYNPSLSLFDEPVRYRCPFKDTAEILGSCNGLICIQTEVEMPYIWLLYRCPFKDTAEILGSCNSLICIWNPCTEEYVELPRLEGGDPDIRSFGFGYDCETGDYKVVRIVTPDEDLFSSQVMVHTLGTDSWRVMEDIPYICIDGQNGVHINGVVYWVLCNEEDDGVLVSFNISDEKFDEIQVQLPIPCYNEWGDVYSGTSLCLLDERLCFLGNQIDRANVDVWILEDDGESPFWDRYFHISTLDKSIDMRLIQSFHNGEVLLCSLNTSSSIWNFVLYNPTTRIAKSLGTHAYRELVNMHTYVGSLVSVKSVCNVGQEET